MCEEKKIPQEIENEDELDFAAGGTGEGVQWRCRYCGALMTIKSSAETKAHYLSCANSPYNPANK